MPDLDGLHPAVRAAVQRILAEPEARKHGLYVVSAYRSPQRQSELYREAEERCRRDSSRCPASKWVARPWRSNHGPVLKDGGQRVPYGEGQGGKWGVAVDFGVPGVRATSKGQWPTGTVEWVSRVARRHGLAQAMQWEDWHYEPVAGFDYTIGDDDDMPLNNEDKQWLDGRFGNITGTITTIQANLAAETNQNEGKIDKLFKELEKLAAKMDALEARTTSTTKVEGELRFK